MAQKEITFTYEGAKYTLAFNRKTVQSLSRAGFELDMIGKKPALGIPMLFRGAFMVHHRNIKDDLVNKIYDDLVNKEELISKLMEMYSEPINAMFEEPEEESEKKVAWEANY